MFVATALVWIKDCFAGRYKDHQASDVTRRNAAQPPVLRSQLQPRGGGEGGGRQVVVGEHDALRRAGGPGGEGEIGDLVGVRVGPGQSPGAAILTLPRRRGREGWAQFAKEPGCPHESGDN